jgi:hypothetical protein
MKAWALALLVTTLAVAPGCYTVKFVSPEAAGARTGQSFDLWTHSLFWGLVPLGEASIDMCGSAGVKRMKSQIGGLGLVAYVLTAGIWTPMHVRVVCAQPGSVGSDD